ncbi:MULTISPECIES: hypothetical protein [unclassified Streptomyces]
MSGAVDGVRVELLGPVQIVVEGKARPAGTQQQRLSLRCVPAEL